MKTKIVDWLLEKGPFIIEAYPDARGLLWFLDSFFEDASGTCDYVELLRNASIGLGINTPTEAAYLLHNDESDGEFIHEVEFHFDGEFYQSISINTFVAVLEVVTSEYVKYYPEDAERAKILFNKAKLYLLTRT